MPERRKSAAAEGQYLFQRMSQYLGKPESEVPFVQCTRTHNERRKYDKLSGLYGMSTHMNDTHDLRDIVGKINTIFSALRVLTDVAQRRRY